MYHSWGALPGSLMLPAGWLAGTSEGSPWICKSQLGLDLCPLCFPEDTIAGFQFPVFRQTWRDSIIYIDSVSVKHGWNYKGCIRLHLESKFYVQNTFEASTLSWESIHPRSARRNSRGVIMNDNFPQAWDPPWWTQELKTHLFKSQPVPATEHLVAFFFPQAIFQFPGNEQNRSDNFQ